MSIQSISRLGTFEYLTDVDMLRATVFWQDREAIMNNPKKMQTKPAYRLIKIFINMAEYHKVNDKDFNEYIDWLQEPIDDKELVYDSVKRFRKNYGRIVAFHYMLSAKASTDLFINTVLKKRL